MWVATPIATAALSSLPRDCVQVHANMLRYKSAKGRFNTNNGHGQLLYLLSSSFPKTLTLELVGDGIVHRLMSPASLGHLADADAAIHPPRFAHVIKNLVFLEGHHRCSGLSGF